MTSQAMWTRPLGDTGPALAAILRDDPAPGQRVGTPRNLTEATVVGTVRRWSDRAIVTSAAATVVSAAAGQVQLPLTTLISTSPGLHAVSFTVTGTDVRTYPGPMDPWWLTIAAPLQGGAAAPMASPDAPLTIAAAGTGTVTTNGQIVFAGPSSTVVIPPAVTWFQLAASGVWTPGTTPTLVQAGSAVDSQVPATLLASGGNLVVVTAVAPAVTATATGRATLWAYNGTTYAPDPDARIFERALTDPAPTGLAYNDIVLTEN